MKFLDYIIRQGLSDRIQKIIECNEVVGSLYDVIDRHRVLVFETYHTGFKDVACLFLREFASLYTIGIISQLHLCLMIQAAFAMRLLLICEQRCQLIHCNSCVCISTKPFPL